MAPSSVSDAVVVKLQQQPAEQKKKKRQALADVSNRQIGSARVGSRVAGGSQPKNLVPCSVRNAEKKNDSVNTLSASARAKSGVLVPYEDEALHKDVQPSSRLSVLPSPTCTDVAALPSRGPTISEPRITDVSPTSVGGLLYFDETMSMCDSLESPEFEYMDNAENSEVHLFEMKKALVLSIPQQAEKEGKICVRNITVDTESSADASPSDDDYADPQSCATIASDIYRHLRVSEEKKRPSFVYMERVQRDVSSSMRAIVVDWLVEVAEEYRLIPETLYLAVNYIDRYLSGCALNRNQLQLLGVACLMIACKYEEICVPLVEEFCLVTDSTYSRDELLEMESAVLDHLKFDMAAPTAHCFLRHFVHAAQKNTEVLSMKFECLANYITELSLVEYRMLRYAPSLIAASATFLAKFMLSPSEKPWNSTLRQYSLYQPSDLFDSVKALHRLCSNSSFNLPAVREKYSQHKYKFVAKKYCPITIPPEYFQD